VSVQPDPSPEGALIREARRAAGLSFRKIAGRAGISYGRWRQIEAGYQNVTLGVYEPVRAPDRTVARMAAVVGVSPEQLEEAGRADAAAVLRSPYFRLPDPNDDPAPALASTGDPAMPADLDKAETYVWRGPGTERQRRAMIAAYRQTRYQEWVESMNIADPDVSSLQSA
jgi:transcriptional regulator with XRE-family HTH domain